MSIHNIDFVQKVEVFNSVYLWSISFILLLCNVLTTGYEIQIYIQHAFIMIGIACTFIIASRFTDKGIETNSVFYKATFFIFAAHAPYMGTVFRLIYNRIPIFESSILNDLVQTLCYLTFNPAFVIALVLAYKLIGRIFPRFARILVGCR